MALVTIVLERAWAALKCDQLPVGETRGYPYQVCKGLSLTVDPN